MNIKRAIGTSVMAYVASLAFGMLVVFTTMLTGKYVRSKNSAAFKEI